MDLFTPGPGVPPADFNWWMALILTTFSVVAGLLGSAMRTADTKQPFRLGMWLAEGLTAGFVGVIVMLIGMGAGWKFEYLGAACGIMGLIGSKVAIQLGKAFLIKQAGLTASDIQAAKDVSNDKADQ